jgi:TRAP transporter TAXI family solute receptor
MRNEGRCARLFIVGLVLVLSTCFAPGKEECFGAEVYPMASASMGGNIYRWMAVVSQVLNQEIKDAQFTVRTGSPTENVLVVEEGDVALAGLSPNDYFVVHPDDPKFQKTRIRTIWPMVPFYRYLIVPAQSPYRSYSDLKGKKIVVGIKTGEGGDFVRMAKAMGWSDADMKGFYFIGKDEGLEAYKDKTVEAWTGWGPIPSPQLVQLEASRNGARLLPMTPTDMKAIERAYPVFKEAVIPAGSHKVVDKDSPTLSNWYIMVARDDFPEKIAYEMAKAIDKRLRDIDAGYKGAGEVTPDKAAKFSFFKLHTGVARFLKEKGIIK